MKRRVDPLLQLALLGKVPIPSGLAHREQCMRISYLSVGGVMKVFTGAPKDLDWTDVEKVADVVWLDPLTDLPIPVDVESNVPPGLQSLFGGVKAGGLPPLTASLGTITGSSLTVANKAATTTVNPFGTVGTGPRTA